MLKLSHIAVLWCGVCYINTDTVPTACFVNTHTLSQALYDESKTPLAQAQAAIQSLHQELDVFRHREDKFRKDVEVCTTMYAVYTMRTTL
jgi:hypothetical protein